MNLQWFFICLSALLAINSLSADEEILNEALLETIAYEISDSCVTKSKEQECFELIREVRESEELSHPRVQFLLTELLITHAEIHPSGLSIAKEILEELIAKFPDDVTYQEQVAYIEYMEFPLDGIFFAMQEKLYSTLAVLLQKYLVSNHINDDIVNFSLKGFEQRSLLEIDIPIIVAEAQVAIELIRIYQDESAVETFITEARNLIPWDSWRESKTAKESEFELMDSTEVRNIIITYCQPTMLLLDEGSFCAETVEFIKRQANDDVFASKEFVTTADWAVKEIKNLNPLKIGNASEILNELVSNR